MVGAETNRKDYGFLKSVSINGTDSYRSTDAAITEITFDTAFAFHPSILPVGVNVIKFLPAVTVQNTGTETINSFNLNATTFMNGPCGPVEFIKRVSNITLQPGQSMQARFDTLVEFPLVFNPPYTYTFCAWVSCPDSASDKFHGNDYWCDSFVIDEIVDIDKIFSNNYFEIYPNPNNGQFTVDLFEKFTGQNPIEVYNVLGEKVFETWLHQNPQTINVPLNPGLYFVRIADDEHPFVGKLVVE
jgi:hypothetical protein